MTDDLIERLRATAKTDAAYGYKARGGLFDAAAHRIEELSAENERLREALRDVTDYGDLAAVRIARAALKG